MNIKNKNVLVYGMSLSGEWASRLLIKHKANVFLFDDDGAKLKSKPIKNCYVLQNLNRALISQFDFIVASPSIEKDNKFLVMAQEENVKIYSEIELASQFCKNLVAVTGTNGKTTTVELITALINQKTKAVACGNIGYPLSRAVLENKHCVFVAEVSSFMLENCDSFCPHVATILNIEPDHLIRHKTMEEYAKLKYQIYKNLTKKDYAIVNLDSKIKPNNDCLTITYSYNKNADVYVKNGAIYLHQQKIININELKIKGRHNVYNVMCAVAYASIFKVKTEKMRAVLINFLPDKFRIEHVAKINNVNFVNDSKSTNIASTLACVDAIKGSIILLLGGSNKNLYYSELFNKLSLRVKAIFAYGEIAQNLIEANNNKFNITKCANLEAAFDSAVKIALPFDTILLSPASASYDQFSSYIERGNAFNKKVSQYEAAIKKV